MTRGRTSRTTSTTTRSDVLLGLGSNADDAPDQILKALRALHRPPDLTLISISHFYRSEPWGVPVQPFFLNAAARGQTPLSPEDLLARLKGVETDLGRREGTHWGPRLIDLDLLAYASRTLDTPRLTVPHPFFLERSFAFYPAAEIWPDWVHPLEGRDLRELARTLVFSTASIRLESPSPDALMEALSGS